MEDIDIFDKEAAEYEREFHREVEEVAAERDCDVMFSSAYTLQIDLDSEEALDHFKEQMYRVRNFGGAYADLPFTGGEHFELLPSRNGNWHAIIRTHKSLTVEERILWQAVLGSDNIRELLNLLRHKKGVKNPIRLFRPKE